MNLTLLITNALRESANQLAEIMGWGAGCYSIPVSSDGSEPATHWGLNLAAAQPEFMTMLAGASQGQMPDALDGFPAEAFAAIMGALIVEADCSFDEALARHGLVKVEGEAV